MPFSLPATIIISFLALLALVGIIASVYFWYKSKKFTRERFAFAGLVAMTSLLFIVVTSTFIGPAPWQVLFSLVAQILRLDYTPKEVATSEYLLFVLSLGIFVYFIIKIHENWAGAKSEEQHKREQRQEFGGLAIFVIEGVSELKRTVKRLPPPEIYKPDDTSGLDCVLEGSQETLVWYEQAVELMMLLSKSYFFDKDDGWHDQEKCWVGRNKKLSGK